MTGANINNDVSTCRVTCSDNNTLSSQTADKRGYYSIDIAVKTNPTYCMTNV